MIIVSDTSPINYLVLIGHIEILERLFGRVIVPQAVVTELQREKTPQIVREWITSAPSWLEIKRADISLFASTKKLGDGEREAIALAIELQAAAILIDDRDGIKEARRQNLTVVSTLSLLEQAARMELLELPATIDRLKQTTFRLPPPEILQEMLGRDAERKGAK
jgi:predicted nucleic acid-binding protein